MAIRVRAAAADRLGTCRARGTRHGAERSVQGRVLALQRAAGNRATVAMLARQAQAPAGELGAAALPDLRLPLPQSCLSTGRSIQEAVPVRGDPDARRVTLDDGSRYLVRRRRRLIFSERYVPLPPRLSWESDADRVWAQLEWCRDGGRGTIQLGANPQQAGRAALQAVFDTISSGGSAEQALEAALDTEVTPFIDVDLGRSGEWRVTGDAEVILNREGFRGAGGGIGVHVGRIRIRGGVTVRESDRGTDVQPSIGIEIPLERPPTFTCRRKERLYVRQRTEFEWTRWVPEHERTIETPRTREVPSDYYVYFRYASDQVDEGQSASERAALLAEMARGGQVSGITGFTSPEGSHQPGSRRWQGNVRLAEQRAEGARAWVQSVIGEAGAGTLAPNAPVVGAAEPELHTLQHPETDAYVEGRELESHAISEFHAASAEERHRAQVLAELAAARGGSRARAEIVYRRLRRAAISVTRTERYIDRRTVLVPGRWASEREICTPVPDAETAEHFPRPLFENWTPVPRR